MPPASQDSPELDRDDGLVVSDAGDWAPEKHDLLTRYVESTWGARARWGSPAYLDLFSGPGRQYVQNSDRLINGSPVHAWVASKLERAPFRQVFISDREDYARACETRLKRLGAPVTVAALNAGDAAHVAAKRMDPNGLHLVFADPYNLRELAWATFQPLLTFEHIDFIVHFSQSDLNRNLDLYYTQANSPLDSFAPGWREKVTRGGRGETKWQIFGYWISLWERAGFNLAAGVPLVKSSTGAPLYRLMLFSRHPLADKIWKSVSKSKFQPELPF